MKVTSMVVLISGNGSNLQALIDAIRGNILRAEIKAVISNTKEPSDWSAPGRGHSSRGQTKI
jgi:folate-dependent phosphoribosylglycinamide formyltransferase PurN